MILTKRRAAVAATAITVAMIAAACGNGTTETTVTPGPVETVAPDGNVAEGGDNFLLPANCPIDAAHTVGAMPDFGVGTHFRATEPITIDLLYRVHAGYPVMDDWLIWSAFRDSNNVSFNREDVLFADWDNRRALAVAAGDFPTLVPVVWGGQDAAWWAGGNLLPVSDYFGCMPNLEHFAQAWGVQEELDDQRQADGKIYNLRGFRQSPDIARSVAVNVDLFEQAGVDIQSIHTFDDLAAALRQVQDNTDVDYAWSERWNEQASGPLGAILEVAGPNFGTSGGWNRNVHVFDHDAGEFVPRVATDGYRQMVEFFANLRSEGVLDPEITQTDDAAIQKFVNGRSAVISADFTALASMRNTAQEAGTPINAEIIMVPMGPAGDYIAGTQLGPGVVLNSDVRNSPNFLAILQFLDWLYFSEEGREFAQWGVEGTTFERDAEGNRVLVGALADDPRGQTGVLQQDFGFRDGVWMQNWGGSDDLFTSVMIPEQREWYNAMADRKSVRPLDPGFALTEAEQEQIGGLTSSVQDATDSGVAQFILGTRPMSEWDAFVSQIRGAGADQIINTINAAHARR